MGFGIGCIIFCFNLSDEFVLESYVLDDKFKIQMNVCEWERKSSWNIPIKEERRKENLESGVVISILKINNKIQDELLSRDFQKLECN